MTADHTPERLSEDAIVSIMRNVTVTQGHPLPASYPADFAPFARAITAAAAAHLADVEESARTAWAVHAEHVDRANGDLLHQMSLCDEARAHLADVEARLAAVEAEHRVIHQAAAELVCFCGAHLSVYGLTRSLASVFAQHVRDARALHPAPRPASMFQAAGFDTDDPDLHPHPERGGPR